MTSIITDSTGKEQFIKVRCAQCRGTGGNSGGCLIDICGACNGFGFTREVFKLTPPPKTLRQRLALSEADPGDVTDWAHVDCDCDHSEVD